MLHFDSNKSKRINQKQKQILYAAMATNRKILDCTSGDTNVRRVRKAVWKRVALELNMAGPEKDITQWRKVWTDLRLGMRKKWEKAQKSQYILTEYERRVIDACGMLEKTGDESSNEKSAEEINDFLAYLQEELVRQNEPQYFKEDITSSSMHMTDSSDFLNLRFQSTDEIHFRDEYGDESSNIVDNEDPSIECISDDEEINRHEEFRESSIECISDEESIIIDEVKIENNSHLSYEDLEEMPQRPEVSQQILEEFPKIPLKSEAEVPTLPQNNKRTLQNKKIKNASLKEIKKMHRNLLRESKKQTALLRKLVYAMQNK